jgi:hypothetical protein
MTDFDDVQQVVQAPGGAGLSALARYEPTWLSGSTWRAWRPRVLALVGASQPDNASLARLSAGVLCELISLVGPEVETDWRDVLSEANIRVLQAGRGRRGQSSHHISRGLAELSRLQRVANGLTTRKAPSERTPTEDRSQLEALAILTDAADPVLAEHARTVLSALTDLRRDPWPMPLIQEEWTVFAKGARAAGFTKWRWRWRELKAERVRRDFSDARPVASILSELKPGHKRFDGLISGVWAHVPTEVSLENASRLRGTHLESQSVAWRIGAKEAALTDPAPKPARKPRKFSASAARRRREELLARRASDPEPLPGHLEAVLNSWTPRVITPEQWAASRPLTVRILRRSKIRGQEKFAKTMRVVAQYVTWTREAGYDQDEERLLASRVIEDFISRGMRGAEDASRSTARSMLRSIATHAALGPDAPVKSPPIAHWEISPPYRDREIRTFLGRIEMVREPAIRRRLETAFALGLGAGLEARDLRDLTRAHVHDLGSEGIRIDVPGERSRTVWLRHDLEDLLRSGISRLTTNEHILGRPNAGKDILVDLYDNARSLRGDEKIQQRRLRNTWLATLMCEPIPLWTVMRAAGLASARSLSDLAQFLEPVGDNTLTRGGAQ